MASKRKRKTAPDGGATIDPNKKPEDCTTFEELEALGFTDLVFYCRSTTCPGTSQRATFLAPHPENPCGSVLNCYHSGEGRMNPTTGLRSHLPDAKPEKTEPVNRATAYEPPIADLGQSTTGFAPVARAEEAISREETRSARAVSDAIDDGRLPTIEQPPAPGPYAVPPAELRDPEICETYTRVLPGGRPVNVRVTSVIPGEAVEYFDGKTNCCSLERWRTDGYQFVQMPVKASATNPNDAPWASGELPQLPESSEPVPVAPPVPAPVAPEVPPATGDLPSIPESYTPPLGPNEQTYAGAAEVPDAAPWPPAVGSYWQLRTLPGKAEIVVLVEAVEQGTASVLVYTDGHPSGELSVKVPITEFYGDLLKPLDKESERVKRIIRIALLGDSSATELPSPRDFQHVTEPEGGVFEFGAGRDLAPPTIMEQLHAIATELDVEPLAVVRFLESTLATVGQLVTFKQIADTSPFVARFLQVANSPKFAAVFFGLVENILRGPIDAMVAQRLEARLGTRGIDELKVELDRIKDLVTQWLDENATDGLPGLNAVRKDLSAETESLAKAWSISFAQQDKRINELTKTVDALAGSPAVPYESEIPNDFQEQLNELRDALVEEIGGSKNDLEAFGLRLDAREKDRLRLETRRKKEKRERDAIKAATGKARAPEARKRHNLNQATLYEKRKREEEEARIVEQVTTGRTLAPKRGPGRPVGSKARAKRGMTPRIAKALANPSQPLPDLPPARPKADPYRKRGKGKKPKRARPSRAAVPVMTQQEFPKMPPAPVKRGRGRPRKDNGAGVTTPPNHANKLGTRKEHDPDLIREQIDAFMGNATAPPIRNLLRGIQFAKWPAFLKQAQRGVPDLATLTPWTPNQRGDFAKWYYGQRSPS